MVMDYAIRGIEPPAAVLELIALTLICRDAAGDADPATDPDPNFYPPNIQAAAQDALDAGAMIALFDSPPTDAIGQVVYHSTQREIMLRNPVYPHMLLDTLRGLFGDHDLDADCRAVLGFTGFDATNVMEAVRTSALDELSRRFERMESVRDASLPLITNWAEERRHAPASQGGEGKDHLDPEHRRVAEEIYAAVQDLTTFVDQAAVIDFESVAEATGLPVETVSAVVDAFTLTGLSGVDAATER
jgi:hypothetical protein